VSYTVYINYKGTAVLFPVNGNFVDFDVLLWFLLVLWIRIGFSADPVIPHLALLDLEPDSYSQMRIRIQPDSTKMNTVRISVDPDPYPDPVPQHWFLY
jgi:hypothetical protein